MGERSASGPFVGFGKFFSLRGFLKWISSFFLHMFVAFLCQAHVAIQTLMHIAIRQAKKNAALFILWNGGQNPFHEQQLF